MNDKSSTRGDRKSIGDATSIFGEECVKFALSVITFANLAPKGQNVCGYGDCEIYSEQLNGDDMMHEISLLSS